MAMHMGQTRMEVWIPKMLFTLFSQHTFPIILTKFLIYTVTRRNLIHPEKTLCLNRRYTYLL